MGKYEISDAFCLYLDEPEPYVVVGSVVWYGLTRVSFFGSMGFPL